MSDKQEFKIDSTREKQISVGALTAIMMYNHMLVDPLIAIFVKYYLK